MTDQDTRRQADIVISLGDLHEMIIHCIERTHFFTRLDMGLDDITSVVSKEIGECMQPVDANYTEQ